MNFYEPGWFEKHRYPGGWRKTSHLTEAENAATFALLEKQRLKLERGKPLTIAIDGQEYGRQHYIHQRAGELSGTAWNNLPSALITEFLKTHGEIHRRRTRWGLYYKVSQFEKTWQKRLARLSRTSKLRKKIDENPNQTHGVHIKKANH
jgi:hypothetical protein